MIKKNVVKRFLLGGKESDVLQERYKKWGPRGSSMILLRGLGKYTRSPLQVCFPICKIKGCTQLSLKFFSTFFESMKTDYGR